MKNKILYFCVLTKGFYAYVYAIVLFILMLQGCSSGKRDVSGKMIPAPAYSTSDKVSAGMPGETGTAAGVPGSIPVRAGDGHVRSCRVPDFSVRVKGGDALMLETAGLRLTAGGEAVKYSGVYSVTALTEHELPPLPQGMVNMTAVAAGYRLLPSGDHFDPPAELRVGYDPSLLPPGYTPTTYTPATTTAHPRRGCAWSAQASTPPVTR